MLQSSKQLCLRKWQHREERVKREQQVKPVPREEKEAHLLKQQPRKKKSLHKRKPLIKRPGKEWIPSNSWIFAIKFRQLKQDKFRLYGKF